ncbi:MAG: hypothetical protein Q9187_009093, partial [Circinaria calcarea]
MSISSNLLSKREYVTVTGPEGTVRYTSVPTVPYNPVMPYRFVPIDAGLTNGQIAGIAVSSVVLAILIPYVGWVVYKKRQHQHMGQYPEPKGPGKLAGLKNLFMKKNKKGSQGDLEKGGSGHSTPVGHATETVISDHHGDGPTTN